MALSQVYEGTLDEIVARYGKELNGYRLKIVIDEGVTPDSETARPFYETATPEEWSRALHEWAAGHDAATPLLSDADIDRESVYEGRGE